MAYKDALQREYDQAAARAREARALVVAAIDAGEPDDRVFALEEAADDLDRAACEIEAQIGGPVENPYDKEIGRWTAIDIFRDSIIQRMLRLLWTAGEMPQSVFWERYHHADLSLEGPRRGSRKTALQSSFSHNVGNFVRYEVCKYCLRRLYQPRGETWMSSVDLRAGRESPHCEYRPQGRHMLHEPKYSNRPADPWSQGAYEQWRYHQVVAQIPQGRTNLLRWVGPTKGEWVSHLTGAELEKAFESMEAQMIARADENSEAHRDDVAWVDRLKQELQMRKNTGRWNAKINPSSGAGPQTEARAVEKFVEFHRFDPKMLEEIDCSIPTHVVEIGPAKWVTYRSGKVDPDTLVKPRGTVDYIHQHDAGVKLYLPADDVDNGTPEETPRKLRETTALVRLGVCLGFGFVDDGDPDQEQEAEVARPYPELWTTADGRTLLVIQGRREVLAMMWGGALGVEARGIVG